MSYQPYNRKYPAKNRLNNRKNQRNDSGSRNNHLNSSLYGIPTLDEKAREEESLGLKTCGETSAIRNPCARHGGRTTNVSTDPNSMDESRVQTRIPQANRGNDSGNGYQKVTVAIPGCKPQSFTVCVGNDPKDVQKWIQERRANYPTKAKILLKEQQKQATDKATTYITPSASISQTTPTTNNIADTLNAISETNSHEKKSLLGSLLAGYDSSSSTGSKDEQERDDNHQSPFHPISLPPTEYNTGSITLPGEHLKASNTIIESPASSVSNAHFKKTCRYFLRGKCFRGKECTFLHGDTIRTAFTEAASESVVRPTTVDNQNIKRYIEEEEQQPENDKKQGTHQEKKKARRPPRNNCSSNTLLRKLLENDIKREACITVQLLRYIVQSNFFDDQTIQKSV